MEIVNYIFHLCNVGENCAIPYIMDNEPWVKESIATRLKWLRSRSGLSQSEFAETLGVSVTNYNNWERGRQRLSLDGAFQVNRIYGTTLDFLYLGRLDTLSPELVRSFAEFNDSLDSSGKSSIK